MTFPDTLNIVNDGNKCARFRRPSWEPGKYIAWVINSQNKDHSNPPVLAEDFMANDWEVISD